jgi:hypothetical protein
VLVAIASGAQTIHNGAVRLPTVNATVAP